MSSTPLRHVTRRYEQGAAFMADGYARVSGEADVCVLIAGLGLTNAVTAMAQADSVPMLVRFDSGRSSVAVRRSTIPDIACRCAPASRAPTAPGLRHPEEGSPMMERTGTLSGMKALELFGMRAGSDEIVAVVPEARCGRDGQAPARAATRGR